ncbi:hypothetical protein EH223_13305 [candidate division KSB1 bacterium]|nr:hypothetical protein [candidate division KSB1 bacterium]RQW02025.1 MAG: hypothetical protein EH223_13305 [candidate division KSB1 bacterium]
MLNYVAPAHLFLTVILALLYVYLAIRFFRNKNSKSASFDRFLAHIARYILLVVYVSGIVMSVSMGMMVSRIHHVISLVPALLMVGIRYVPLVTRRANTLKLYAWLFVFLFILMIVLGVTSRLSHVPQF